MHRRELEVIANTIRERRQHHKGIGTMSEHNRTSLFCIEALAKDIAEAFKRDNPKFNKRLFFEACGMNDTPQ